MSNRLSNTEISLSLTPGVLFASSNYWAFSVLVCVDEQVVEERFIDWGKATDSLHENYHAQGLERLSFDFDGLYSAPLRTFSIGFFVYYIDPLNGVNDESFEHFFTRFHVLVNKSAWESSPTSLCSIGTPSWMCWRVSCGSSSTLNDRINSRVWLNSPNS